MSLTDDLRAAAGGVDRRYKVERRRVLTRGPVSVQMLLQAADELEQLREVLQQVVSGRWPPPPEWYWKAQRLLISETVAREALGDE